MPTCGPLPWQMMQPVLGLVEDDGVLEFEDAVGDLGAVEAVLSCSRWPRTVLRSCTAGRQCRNFVPGLPVPCRTCSVTWYGRSIGTRLSRFCSGSPMLTHTSV